MSSFFAALAVVFLAELGDKTQLVALGFGARYRLAPVLAGVAAAYMASTLLSVLIGGVLGAALPTDAISIGGGLLFVGFAIWTLMASDAEDVDVRIESASVATSATATSVPATSVPMTSDAATSDAAMPDAAMPDAAIGSAIAATARTGDVRIVASVAVAMFLAELGDKTMLATATLAASSNPVLVWAGATIGITLAGTVGVIIGRLLGDRLPERAIQIGSSMLFAVFGVVLIVTGLQG